MPALTIKAQGDTLISHNAHIRFAPLSLLDFYSGSSYKVGFEAKLFNRASIYADAGGYLRNFNVWKNFIIVT